MIEENYYIKLKYRLSTGESSLAFKQLMISNFTYWEQIELNEIIDILDIIKTNKLSLYAFIPFWHNLVGVDLFDLYKRRNKDKWNNKICNEIIENFENYPKIVVMSDFSILAENNLSLVSFLHVRSRLLSQGLLKVKYISIRFPPR